MHFLNLFLICILLPLKLLYLHKSFVFKKALWNKISYHEWVSWKGINYSLIWNFELAFQNLAFILKHGLYLSCIWNVFLISKVNKHKSFFVNSSSTCSTSHLNILSWIQKSKLRVVWLSYWVEYHTFWWHVDSHCKTLCCKQKLNQILLE